MRRFAIALAAALLGCGGDEAAPKHPPPKKPLPVGCVPGEVTLEDGSCLPAGVPPEACGEGFEAMDGGCNAILPADPCGPGQMALPGETACHEVSPCGAGDWGDIPVDGSTEFVDASFTGTSDGSQAAPWTKIKTAVSAAAKGAIVAIAAGSYAEDVQVGDKPVRLWGRCPAMVEIVNQDPGQAGVVIFKGASGTEVRGVALGGAGRGLVLSGSESVVVDGVWVHDTPKHGIDAANALGTTSIAISNSLVESVVELGIFVEGAKVDIDRTVVRGVRHGTPTPAAGIAIENAGTVRSQVTIGRSVLDRNDDAGLEVAGSDVVVEASVLRDTQLALDMSGAGIQVAPSTTGDGRGNLTLRGSVLERNAQEGLFVLGSDATIENTSIRDTVPAQGFVGYGLQGEFNGTSPANLVVRGSLIERCQGIGIAVEGSSATVESTIVRGIVPFEDESLLGGVVAVDTAAVPPGTLEVRGSVIEQVPDAGIYIRGMTLLVETTALRDVQPRLSGLYGRGIEVDSDLEAGRPAQATLRGVSVERSHEAAIVVVASDATLEDVVVTDTQPRATDMLAGDGLVVVGAPGEPASAQLTRARVERSARAAISCFSASIGFSGTTLECNKLDLDGETDGGLAYAFDDQGGNVCGCNGKAVACQAKSTNIAPPDAVPGQ